MFILRYGGILMGTGACVNSTHKGQGTTPDVLQLFPFFLPSIWDRVSQWPGAVAHLPS